MEEPRHVLAGPRLSSAAELLRWLFERSGLAYEERPRILGFERSSQHASGEAARPLLLAPAGPIAGLRACLLAFDAERRAGEKPFGDGGSERERTLALVDRFCEGLHLPATQLFWAHMLDHPELAARWATAGEPRWRAEVARRLHGRWTDRMRESFGVEPQDMAAAKASVDAVFEMAASEAAGGRPFLAGETPGGADVVFAALASPLLLPERYGAPYPGLDGVGAPLRDLVEHYRATSAGRLALRVYETRPAPQPAMARPRTRTTLLERVATPKTVRACARLAARFGPRRVTLRGTTVVFRWADVADMLDRDGDFLIAPVNAARIEAASGPFILGMDRSPGLFAQRRAVYSALAAVDRTAVETALTREPEALIEAALRTHGRIDVVNGYARPVAARVAAALFGVSGPTEADLTRVARAVFRETFLNLGADAGVRGAGIAAGRELSGWIDAEAARRKAAGATGGDLLGRLLAATARGEIAPSETGPILAGLLVGSIDTTATAVANVVAEMLADPALGEAVARDADDRERVLGWCLEALRRRPHNPILLREAVDGATAAGRPVAAGSRAIAVTLSAMQDPRAFDRPEEMRPTRPRALYMHFGRGMHLCSGRDLNQIQIPALVAALARRRPAGKPRATNRGPFPDELVVTLEGRP